MKFKLVLKTPDVMNYIGPSSIYDDSPDAIDMRGCANKFIGCIGDDIVIEFNTETGTAILVPLKN